MNIVLVEPEIPQNTGNIARTCAATGIKLHLVKPLGFSVSDKHLKRAGLDYWHLVDIEYHDNIESLHVKYPEGRFFYGTTKAHKTHSDVAYKEDDFLVFGPETRGLPMELLQANEDTCIRIPMKNDARSLNLSNSVAIVAYEALRQLDYRGLR
jgi:tRNA (cytidine/uridine-2'-O-)-methyltransferase